MALKQPDLALGLERCRASNSGSRPSLPACQLCSLSLGWHDPSASHPLSNPGEKRHLLHLASSSSSALSLFFLVQVTCLSLKQSLQPKGWKDWKGLGSVPPGATDTEDEAGVVARHGARPDAGRAEQPPTMMGHHARNTGPEAGAVGLKENGQLMGWSHTGGFWMVCPVLIPQWQALEGSEGECGCRDQCTSTSSFGGS